MKVKPYGPISSWLPMTSGNAWMGISMGSANHSGERLESIVEWINSARFDSLRIGISDVLNAHNHIIAGHIDPKEAAQKEGDDWLDKNEKILRNLKIPYEIFRWSDWYKASAARIEKNRTKYMTAFRNDPVFREALLADMDAFFIRKGKNLADMSVEEGKHSLNYLIEELSVYEEIFEGYTCTVIYPGKQLKCFECIRSGKAPMSESIAQTSYLRLNLHQKVATGTQTGTGERIPVAPFTSKGV